mgnify:CR=1 FL=1
MSAKENKTNWIKRDEQSLLPGIAESPNVLTENRQHLIHLPRRRLPFLQEQASDLGRLFETRDQLFVMQGEGWTEEAGIELELTKFSSGPAIVQAIAAGDFDVMYFGIGPAMVSRARGVPIW